MKKITAFILALVMVLGMGVTAFAADDGSITVKNATIGKDYAVFKLFDLTYSTDASGNTNVAYSYTKSGESDALYDALVAEGSPFVLTAVDGKYNVTRKDSATDSNIIDFVKELSKDKKITQTGSTVKAAEDTVVFNGLPYGYYVVTSTLGTVITVDSTLKDVTVIDKNQEPTWDNGTDKPGKVIVENGEKKTVNAVNYGDSVNFDIGVNATNFVGDEQITHYYIKDTISAGFDFDLGTDSKFHPVVKVGTKTLTEDADYTVKQSGRDFEIDIKWAEVTTGADGKITEIKSLYDANVEIHVEYSATIHADGEAVVIAGDGNKNTANYTYKTDKVGGSEEHDPKPYKEEKKKTTTTYVYALGVKKVDPKGNALTGAKFSIKKGDTVIKATGSNGVYSYSTDASAVSEFETDANGILLIKGLEEGIYTVKEEVAPAGYNLLTDTVDIKAEIEKTSSYTTSITTYYDAEGNVVSTETTEGTSETTTVANKVVPLVVVNNTGTELPSTGGIGTTIFYIVGSILLLGAAVMLVTKRRMNAE